ncbi:MAG: CBS domain-containing protein [Candidatus Diapherotrites archaeon]|nr:CBS domain-containing protein [Candidatus Diapherotrites archaeon]
MVDMKKIRQTPVKDVMRKKNIKKLKPTDKVGTAIKWLCTSELSMLPVIDGGNYLGEVVEADLLKIVIDPRDMSTRQIMSEPMLGMSFFPESVRHVMRTHNVYLSPDDTLRSAAKKMYMVKAGVLPVIEGGKLVGLLYADDVIARLVKK